MNLFLSALKGENRSSRPPVWLMRQAGRYMQGYQLLRKKYSFAELCKEPELIYQVTKLPITAFGFDAAIIFSDILFIAELFGLKVIFDEGVGPIITPPISSPDDVEKLCNYPLEAHLGYVFSGIKVWKMEEKTPLIGFAGGPFTVACYMIEGKMGKNFQKTKQFYYQHSESFYKLLDRITDRTIEYINGQIDAGVDAIQLFDSWASLLPWHHYHAYAERWLQKLFRNIKPVSTLYFCRGASTFLDDIMMLPIQGISFDSQCDLKKMRSRIGCVLQGNLDPEVLLGDVATVKREVKNIVIAMKDDPGFIFNLGHGVLKDTPERNVQALVDEVHNAANS